FPFSLYHAALSDLFEYRCLRHNEVQLSSPPWRMSQGQRRRLISALASPCQLKALASARGRTSARKPRETFTSARLSRSFHKYSLVLYGLNLERRLWHRRAECCRMPRASPFLIHLSSAEEAELHRRAGKYTLPFFQVQRAKMILLAAQGLSNDEIAAR